MTLARVRTSSVRRGAAPRRRTIWLGVSVNTVSLPDGAATIAGLLDVRTTANSYLVGGTVVRIHGETGVRTDPSTSVVGSVSLGCIVVQGQAFAGSSVPDPFVEVSAPWLWHKDIILMGSGAASLDQLTKSVINNKSMRKLGANDVLVYVAHNNAGVPVTLRTMFRYLVKLP